MNGDNHNCYLYSSSYSAAHDYSSDGHIVFAKPRLAFIVKGRCDMVAEDGQTLSISEGDVWFLPKHIPYRSSWTANGTVEFLYVEFDLDSCSVSYNRFQRIHAPDSLPLFKKTLSSYNSGDTVGALSGLFAILERFLPLLSHRIDSNHSRILPALNYLHENYASPVSVSKLAKLCAMSESYFYSVFKSATAESPIEYKNTLKIDNAVRLIEQGETLESVCEALSFSSPAFLRRLVKRQTGMLPKDIKKNKIKM